MGLHHIILPVLVLAGLQIQTAFSASIPSVAANSFDNVRCGGVSTSPTGVLSYKPDNFQGVRLEPNERCVWIIRVANATRYVVNVRQMGFSNDGNGTQIVFTGIGFGSDNITNHFMPTRENPLNLFATESVIMITFTTGPVVGDDTGFRIEYGVLPTAGAIVAAPESRDYLETTSSLPASIRHPASGEYSNRDVSLFVFAPRNNTVDSALQNEILYTKLGLDGSSCGDALDVLKFNPNSLTPHKWQNDRRICGDVESTTISSPDLIVIVFRSDHTSRSTGFQLKYESINA